MANGTHFRPDGWRASRSVNDRVTGPPARQFNELKLGASHEAEEYLATCPYVLAVRGKVLGAYQRFDDAKGRAVHCGRDAEIYHVGWTHKRLEGADVQVTRSDKAVGPSAHLHGSTLRTVHQRVPVKLTAQVCWSAKQSAYTGAWVPGSVVVTR